jgi:hypothetical protein
MSSPLSPNLSSWTIIPNYGPESQFYYCSNCGLPHRQGTDEPVFRGQHIEMEGYYDVCVDCAVQMGKLAGLLDPETVDHMDETVRRLGAQLQDLLDEVEGQRKLIDAYESLIYTRPRQSRLSDPEE